MRRDPYVIAERNYMRYVNRAYRRDARGIENHVETGPGPWKYASRRARRPWEKHR